MLLCMSWCYFVLLCQNIMLYCLKLLISCPKIYFLYKILVLTYQ
jgi:hypothetical protein